MKKFTKIIVAVLVITMLLSLCACGKKEEKMEKIVFGTSADYPPFEFHVLKDGVDTIVGIDVFLAEKIAEDMGVEIEIKDISFDYLIQELSNGSVDFVIAAMEDDGERSKQVDFSDPYYTDLPAMIVVPADKASEYTSLDSFNGKTVGAQNATTKADIVTNDMPGATLLAISTVTDLINNLVNDKCDAVVLDGAVAMEYVENNDDLVIADVPLGEALPFRVAIQKDDPSGIMDSINKTIAAAIKDGTMDKWIEEANTLSEEAAE